MSEKLGPGDELLEPPGKGDCRSAVQDQAGGLSLQALAGAAISH